MYEGIPGFNSPFRIARTDCSASRMIDRPIVCYRPFQRFSKHNAYAAADLIFGIQDMYRISNRAEGLPGQPAGKTCRGGA